MKKIALVLVAAVGLAGPAGAGPDEAAQFLMKDSASMLDFGVMRLQNLLGDRAFPYYSWDDNALFLSSYEFSAQGTPDELEKMCADWIASLRDFAGIDPGTGGPKYGEVTHFAFSFGHVGFVRTSAPDDLLKNIDQMFLLRCGRGTVEVTAPLRGVGYSLKK